MKVHFACSTEELLKHKDKYRKICSLIKKMGHTIPRDWLEEAIGNGVSRKWGQKWGQPPFFLGLPAFL